MGMEQLPWMGDRWTYKNITFISYIKLEIANTNKLNKALGKNLIVSITDLFLRSKHD